MVRAHHPAHGALPRTPPPSQRCSAARTPLPPALQCCTPRLAPPLFDTAPICSPPAGPASGPVGRGVHASTHPVAQGEWQRRAEGCVQPRAVRGATTMPERLLPPPHSQGVLGTVIVSTSGNKQPLRSTLDVSRGLLHTACACNAWHARRGMRGLARVLLLPLLPRHAGRPDQAVCRDDSQPGRPRQEPGAGP